MSRFSGSYPGYKNPHNKGVMRAYKARKRKEAEERQEAYKKQIKASSEADAA